MGLLCEFCELSKNNHYSFFPTTNEQQTTNNKQQQQQHITNTFERIERGEE